jgi:hypothetical protein
MPATSEVYSSDVAAGSAIEGARRTRELLS